MPVHITNPTDTVAFTLSGTTNLATAVSLPRGTQTYAYQFTTNAGKVADDGTDNVAIGTHHMPIAADTIVEEDADRKPQGARARHCGYITLDDNPTAGELITISDGSTTVIFGFDSGGDTQVTIAGSAALTLDNFVTAINGEGFNLYAQEHPKTDTRLDWISTVAGTTITVTIGAGDQTAVDLGTDRQVVYFGAATVSTVTTVKTRGG